jgi:hypothetical protein
MRDHHRLLGDENPTSGPQGWRLIDACDLLPRRGEPGMAVQLPSQHNCHPNDIRVAGVPPAKKTAGGQNPPAMDARRTV